MCKAIDELVAQGEKRGKIEGKIETLLELVRDGIVDISVAAERLGISMEEFEAKLCR